jgi:hypothetical protein
MFQIINFNEFKGDLSVNEGLGSNVFKIDPDKPDHAGQVGKFSFNLKVQYPEGYDDQGIGQLVTKNLETQLMASNQFMSTMKRTGGIPVIFARRNTTGGITTGGRGVLNGSIVLLDPKLYPESSMSAVPGFKAEGSTVEATVDGKKIYDGDQLKQAAQTGKLPPNFDPNKPVLDPIPPLGSSGTSGGGSTGGGQNSSDKTGTAGTAGKKAEVNKDEVVRGLMNVIYNTSSSQIRTLNGCLIILEKSLLPKLIEKSFRKKEDGTEVDDGFTISDTYNDETAAAIAKVLGKSQPVKQITKEIAVELSDKIIPITKNQFNELLLAVQTNKVPPDYASTSGTSGTSQVPASVTTETLAAVAEGMITGLKKGAKGKNVGVLQLITSAVDAAAANIIKASRGIDMDYGTGTAKAVGQVITGNSNLPIVTISQQIASALVGKIKGLSSEKLAQLVKDVNAMISTGGSSSNTGKEQPVKNKVEKNQSGSVKKYEPAKKKKNAADL